MKKYLITCFALLMMSVLSVNAESVILALHHNGKVTLFNDSQFKAAHEAAEEGDTLYLSEGYFIGDIAISKRIYLIGGGKNTIIAGNVDLQIEDAPEGYMFENIYLKGTVKAVGHNVTGLRMRKVICDNLQQDRGVNGDYIDCFFVNCFFKNIFLSRMRNVSLVNCKVAGLSDGAYSAGSIQFINCNISHWAGGHSATFINSIVYGEWFEGLADHSVLAIHNLSYAQESTRQDCYEYNPENIFDENMECIIPQEAMSQYLGTDSTIVGCYGGETPFTLTPTTPRVLEKTVTLDKGKKTLKVDIKIGTDNE